MSVNGESVADPSLAQTLPQLVRAAAAAYGDEVAITLQPESGPVEALTFREVDDQSSVLARGLLARGVGKGTRVGFICGNGPQFLLMLAAVSRIGAIAIPISTMIKANELVRVLRQSDVTGLIVQRMMLGYDFVERLCDALPDLRENTNPDLRMTRTPFLRWIVSSGDALPPSICSRMFLTDAADTVSEGLLREAEAEVHTTDQMVEIYTSGSMALPKGVKHTHGPVLFRTHWLRGMLGPTRGKEVTAMLPMFWVGGMMMYLLPNLEVGAITVCTERTLSNSRMAMGSVLPDEDLETLSKQPKPWWGLGMSESLGPYSYADEFRAEGYPVCAPMDHFAQGFEVRIADEDNQPVAEGESGEIQIRGYPVSPALHKVERADYFTDDGYYRTGDMGLREGSRVHFVGRSGDMIKTAGSNVSPAEVELELQQLPDVHSAYVVGLPDKERGQLVVAAVVPRDGLTLDFTQIEAEMRKRLSSYKVPRAYVALAREDVPLLHSNKVARRQIETMMAEKLGRV
jgi:acyl-CoA synthetase (AMP-forming)/AMP-acid ligase II